MPSLHEVQHAIRLSLVERDDNAAAGYIVGDGLAPEQRLSVYRNTFVSSLTNALRLSYPAVHRLVGAEFFAGAAQIFVHERPPRGAYLDEYGGEFPEFLASFAPAASLAYLPDVARLEWAVNRALHAPDVAPLDVSRLAELEQTDHERVCFVPHPSVSLVRANYPADAIWRAVLAQDDAALEAIDLTDAPVWFLVQRLATGIDVKRLSEPAWRFAKALCEGRSLHAAVDIASDIDVSTVVAEHLAAGRFVAFNLTELVAAQPSESVL
jgi:hypothetical protein